MPAKMMSEMPLPTPRSVICSPSHIRNMVPVASVSMVVKPERQAGIDHQPLLLLSSADGDAHGLKQRQRQPCRSACTG